MRMFLSTHIDATQEAVFAAASNFPNAAAFISAIDSVEMLTPAKDGLPIGVGTRFKETRTMFGKQATETMEVTEFDPPRAYTLSALSCGVQYHSRVTVLEEQPGTGGGGCRLSYDIKGTPVSLFAKIVGPIMGVMMKGAMRKAMEKDLADIKNYVERGGSAAAHDDDSDSDDN
ncbi:MAG: SRPBCC family protein [Phycisphaerales bacterium JB064]